ncbi:S-adenosyl-L-methionine-dependent methyltransferase, partial [Sporormia fimetaria CBS 119925]
MRKPSVIWYRFRKPAESYRSIFIDYLWIADLGKHLLDYLSAHPSGTVHLDFFKSHFSQFIEQRFRGNAAYEHWIRRVSAGSKQKHDFRMAINAYSEYYRSQALSMVDPDHLLSHPLWAECLRAGGETAVPEQLKVTDKTIATPFVYACFRRMYFAAHLEEVPLNARVEAEQAHRKRAMQFAAGYESTRPRPTSHSFKRRIVQANLKVGDVVGVEPQQSRWNPNDPDWIGYIHRIEPHAEGERLYVLWLYRPGDTTIGKEVFYPIADEVFLSDHCNCEEGVLLSKHVLRKYSVSWRPETLTTSCDLIVRNTFLVQKSQAFVTVRDIDFVCPCHREKQLHSRPKSGDTQVHTRPKRGETYYVRRENSTFLEPFVVEDCDTEEVQVRRLLRRDELKKLACSVPPELKTMADNEVVWTDEIKTVKRCILDRPFHIRFVSVGRRGTLPPPYDRGGVGDHWFVTFRLGPRGIAPFERPPVPLIQALANSNEMLKGLSLFSGGGNLDRGLEEGGGVRFTHAIDISEEAIHTQLANQHGDLELSLYLGSVDDYLHAMLTGHSGGNRLIATIGSIQLIAAGSPCPGFSKMQKDWRSPQSKQNASHITTLCSFLEVYRPEYAILENVADMAHERKHEDPRETLVFKQLISCLVAMGYQVSQKIMDSWSYGSSQRRERLFVCATAPGLEPIRDPPMTHSHPSWAKNKKIGKLDVGEGFGHRKNSRTPFHYVTAERTTAGLPGIGTGFTQVCIPCPDHKITRTPNERDRLIMKTIPYTPAGQGYADAVKKGLIPKSAVLSKSREEGRAFRRITAKKLVPTVSTNPSPHDNRTGTILHWSEPRCLSIMEARRAQGFPDHEVIIGSPVQQWRIIGNAVDRRVALALGLSLRD